MTSSDSPKTENETKFDLLIVNTKSPYGTSDAHESLDLALAAASFDQHVALLFLGDGIFQLIDHQNAQTINQKDLNKMMSAAPMFGLEDVFISESALRENGLESDDLLKQLSPKVLDSAEQAALYQNSKCIIRF